MAKCKGKRRARAAAADVSLVLCKRRTKGEFTCI